jgi:AcrR family transcriptional regulator
MVRYRKVYGDRMSRDPAGKTSRPGPRPRFSRDQVLDAALAMIDDSGVATFSMRLLADRLGVGAMTLYGYVRNKEELLQGVTNLVFRDVHRDLPATALWDEQLRAMIVELHDLCRRHPNLVALVLAQNHPEPGMFRLRERMLDILCTAGFDDRTALYALGVLCNYALGFAGAQAGTPPLELPERTRELPSEEFPRLAAIGQHYALHLSDDAFELGLTLLLRGLRDELSGGRKRT